jgi:hypothetical protein
MKKQFLLVVALIVAGTTLTFAQGGPGGGQRRTVEERVKTAHEKIDSAFKPAADVMTKIDTLFTYYYKGQDAIRAEMMSAGGERPDFQAMQDKMKPLNDAKDTQMKVYLGEENFKIYKEKVEPLFMRGGRGPGGPGGPGGGGNRQN